MATSSPGLFPSQFQWEKPWERGCLNGGSRPSDKGGGGGGHPDPEIRRGPASENFFSALRASFWSKNKGGAPGPPSPSPGPPLTLLIRDLKPALNEKKLYLY